MSVASYWREIPQRYRLEASKCKKCGKILFPPRLVCPECRGREFDKVNLPDKAKILTYTIIHVPPSEFSDEAPYVVAIAEFKNGARLTAQLADCTFDKVKIGMDVKIEFRRILKKGSSGILCYGYKLVPDK
jgi:uncharacterized OB-fold protein